MSSIKDDLISLKNGLPPSNFATAVHKKGIVFVHVPKCAGTSIETALRRKYRISRYIISPSASFDAAERELGVEASDDTRHDVLNLASELRRANLQFALSTGYKCITGHAPLGKRTVDAWKEEYAFVTILRDPIRRFKSHLAFNYSDQSGHGIIEEELDKFFERQRPKTMGALFVKYFSGLPMDADFRSQEALELTKINLEKMDVIGFTDRISDFELQLQSVTGKNIKIGHENKTAAARLDLTPAQIERVEEFCAPDLAIWNWVKAKSAASPETVPA